MRVTESSASLSRGDGGSTERAWVLDAGRGPQWACLQWLTRVHVLDNDFCMSQKNGFCSSVFSEKKQRMQLSPQTAAARRLGRACSADRRRITDDGSDAPVLGGEDGYVSDPHNRSQTHARPRRRRAATEVGWSLTCPASPPCTGHTCGLWPRLSTHSSAAERSMN